MQKYRLNYYTFWDKIKTQKYIEVITMPPIDNDLAESMQDSQIDDSIVTYMVNRGWTVDEKTARKRYLHHLAQQSKWDKDIASKIGGMLIYNQIIEQYLTDIVDMSIHFIKAETWPVAVSLDVELDKATFGKIIEYFKQFATFEPNRALILSYLKKFNIKRNQVVHDLFDVQDLSKLADELDDYADLADDTINLLTKYDDQVCENFRELEKRVNFRKYLK